MRYVDGFIIPMPKKNLPAYRKMAKQGCKAWLKHGALDYYECVGDDMQPHDVSMTFPKLTKLKPDETVVFAFIVFKSRKHRDSVNAKVMKDPSMNPEQWKNKAMPFDMKRMSYGGFNVIVQA